MRGNMEQISRLEKDIYARVHRIKDPVSECRSRWPNFRFEERQERWPSFHPTKANKPKAYYVCALWHGDGHERGLNMKAGEPTATPAEIQESKVLIARAALLNHEHRKAKAIG